MITVFSSTNRTGSYTLRVARLVTHILSAEGFDVQLLSLADLPRGFAWDKIDGLPHSDFDKIADTYVRQADKFVFVMPEYNGSFPGILKTFIDSIPPSFFHEKKAMLAGVSSGRSGALRPLDHFTGILHYLRVEVLADKPKIAGVLHFMQGDELVLDPAIEERFRQSLLRFTRF